MDTKHTPGPWEWINEYRGAPDAERVYVGFHADGRLYGPANPVMHFASRAEAEAFCTEEGLTQIEEWADGDRTARAAIAKATGGGQ